MTDLHYSPNLLQVMDSLWYQQIVLSSDPILRPTPSSQRSSQTTLVSLSVSDLSSTPLPEEEDFSVSSDASPASPKIRTRNIHSDSSADDTDADDYEELYRRKTVSSKNRSNPSSPSVPKHLRNIRLETPLIRKTMSCKTLFELECEEVKGFMDLGFKFNKEKLCPRMMSVIPGLQRLEEYKDDRCLDPTALESKDDESEDLEGKQSGIARPYLSEAWLIKRPDSPLLNLRIPKVSTADDMKKHLKYWARTVASAIELEY